MNIRSLLTAVAILGILGLFVAPQFALGVGGFGPGPGSGSVNSQQATDVPGVLNKILGWLVSVILIVAALAIVIAAFMYITAGGSSEKVQTANRMILYSVIAVVIALLARVLVKLGEFFAGG